MPEDEFELGEQALNRAMLSDVELATLYTLYEYAVTRVEDTAALDEIHGQMQQILGAAYAQARRDYDELGIDPEEQELRYNPRMKGASHEDDEIVVGKSGRIDRPYRLATELTHEDLHAWARDSCGVEEYSAKEEALMQVWNLWYEDAIEDREARTDHFAAVRETYNDYFDGQFGDEIAAYGDRFLALYDDLDGDRTEKMAALLSLSCESLL